ncbi:hypothetical protein [Streptomyces melanosporofaciens]|uniref:Uncharacterized protein n=1 Tax=Streptomyces melanosporofaciens TaxID=67327 RepID=A0A1H4P3T7_STRMJ|nr:hypothetical protein [Streptomyces melanosporofaciens]SEC01975.1 hypothetical protein SAMN04490356_2584 [Streptomyces melanosporofaciens]
MSDRVTPPAEAARALRDIERLRAQGRASEQESRWVSVVFGVTIFAELAAPDFFGDDVRPWISLAVTALILVYAMMLRTPRGGALLGRPTRVRRSEISPRFARLAQLTIVAVVLLGFVGALFLPDHLFPYAGTVAGAVLGATLIIFGRSLQRGLNSLAMRGDGKDGMNGVADGSR